MILGIRRRGPASLKSMFLVVFATAMIPGLTARSSRADELPRKPLLGAALGPVGSDVQKKNKLPDGHGIGVMAIFPGTSAEAAGLRPGDVIRGVDGSALDSTPQLLARLARARPGDSLSFDVVRDGSKVVLPTLLKEKPRKRGEGFDYLYESVTSKGTRLRTIVTRSRGSERRPAILLIQGLGNYSIDTPPGKPMAYDTIFEALTRSGYVTMRVDKPGCGDSEGGPWPEIDFSTELDGYRQALKALKSSPFVDPDRVFLFGHSMGGIMAPLLASEDKVRGVAVYGTVFRTWFEYAVENVRRQTRLAGAGFDAVEQAARDETLFLSELFLARKSPAEIARTHPELRAHMSHSVTQEKYIYGASPLFFQQLSELRLPAAWAKSDAHVLAIWGKGDFVAPGPDHAMIAEAVNEAHPGKGTYLAINCDHGFNKASNFTESFGHDGSEEFNPVIIETLADWMKKITMKELRKRAEYSGPSVRGRSVTSLPPDA